MTVMTDVRKKWHVDTPFQLWQAPTRSPQAVRERSNRTPHRCKRPALTGSADCHLSAPDATTFFFRHRPEREPHRRTYPWQFTRGAHPAAADAVLQTAHDRTTERGNHGSRHRVPDQRVGPTVRRGVGVDLESLREALEPAALAGSQQSWPARRQLRHLHGARDVEDTDCEGQAGQRFCLLRTTTVRSLRSRPYEEFCDRDGPS